MQRDKLDQFIQKYALGGMVNSAKWSCSSNILSTSFITPDKNLLGKVTVNNFDFNDCEFGVYSTDQLQKLLGVLGDNIDLSITDFNGKPTAIKVKNGSISFDYVLADPAVIPEVNDLKRIPEFETKIKLDTKFIFTFIKGKTALSEADTFSILDNDGKVEVVIGYSSINTNRITIPVDAESSGLKDIISFNADLFKEILTANKECTTAVLEVSNDGLARIVFNINDFKSVYYLVATQGVD